MQTNKQTPSKNPVEMLQVVTFNLGKEEYAIDILKVREIIRLKSITQLPHAPDFVRGVINLRGQIIPVVDLRKKLSLQHTPESREAKIIVAEISTMTLGFIVDAVSEVMRIPTHQIEPMSKFGNGAHSEHIIGVGKLENRMVIILALDKIFNVHLEMEREK